MLLLLVVRVGVDGVAPHVVVIRIDCSWLFFDDYLIALRSGFFFCHLSLFLFDVLVMRFLNEFTFEHVEMLVEQIVTDLRDESQTVDVLTHLKVLANANVTLTIAAHSLKITEFLVQDFLLNVLFRLSFIVATSFIKHFLFNLLGSLGLHISFDAHEVFGVKEHSAPHNDEILN